VVLQGRVRIAVVGGALVAGLLFVGLKSDSLKGLQREGTVQDTRQSADMRKVFTYVSWKMFEARPLWGVGFGQFAKEKLPYLTDHDTHLHLETIRKYVHHNTFLSFLTETGVIGLAALLAVQWQWLRTGWRLVRQREPLAQCSATYLWGLLLLGTLGVIFWQMAGHEITFTTLDQSLLHFVAGIGVALWLMAARQGAPIPVAYSTPPWYRSPPLAARR
jgi:O-antigen ligase